MSAPRRRLGFMLFVIITLVLAGSILFFKYRAGQLRSTYQAEAAITPAPTLAPPAIYAKPTEALLRSGSIGPEVTQLQERLKQLGYYEGEVDGQFGGGTRAAVVLFQQQHGLDADGMAGAETLQRIFSEQAQQMTVTPKPELPASRDNLPMLVNRTHAVTAQDVPGDLVRLADVVPKDLLLLKDPEVRASRPAVEALIGMIKAANAAGLQSWQVSEGYRTFERQQQLFEEQVRTHMQDDALTEERARKATEQTVAKPGTSEHHTGLAFDLTVPGYYFGDTPQAKWLAENCWDYGFILRYTANKERITGYLPEPWHVRFVGQPHAQFMRQHDLALEEYLALYQ